MNRSESVANLAAAIAKAQPAIEGAKKDKKNPFFNSSYADLSSVVSALSGPLAANGLSYIQVSHDRDHAAAIETVILHSSGEWVSCGVVAVPVSKGDAQGYGSALTYARRYSLSAAFGVTAEDDDGNAAAKASPKPAEAPSASPTAFNRECFDSLPEAHKSHIADMAVKVQEFLDFGDPTSAYLYIEEQKLDDVEKPALWSLLDSKQRSAIKKASEAYRGVKQATRAERKAA